MKLHPATAGSDCRAAIILVSVPDYRVVPNPLERYNFNDQFSMKKEYDASLKIVGHRPR